MTVPDIKPDFEPTGWKPNAKRHRWGEPSRFQYKTERECVVCKIVKVTRHEPGENAWLEFYRDGERIACERTPECMAI